MLSSSMAGSRGGTRVLRKLGLLHNSSRDESVFAT